MYKMYVLPTIPYRFVKQLNDMCVKFIWNNGTSKIALKILQLNKVDGGLGLVNFEAKDKALKISWLATLRNDTQMANLAYHHLEPKLKEHIWQCNLTVSHIVQLFPENFWVDVLKSWASINYTLEVLNPENQIIWYNSHILIDGKPFFWAEAFDKGLKYVKQLFENGKVISVIRACDLYGLSWLDMQALYAAIPSAWKKNMESMVQGGHRAASEQPYDILLTKTNVSRWVYRQLCADSGILSSKARKWSETLKISVSVKEYVEAMRNIDLITNIPKFRSFQYKMVQNAVITNTLLFKWGMVETENCTMCREDTAETILHLFIYCKTAQTLWTQLEQYLNKRFGVNPAINFQVDTVIFNRLVPAWNHVKNFMCLLMKYHIYRQRCLKKAATFIGYQNYAKSIENIEEILRR